MDFLDELRRQLAFHEEQVKALKTILDGQSKVYESSISKISSNRNEEINNIVVNSIQDLSENSFPIEKSKRHQVIWLFENVLKKATRMPDIQNVYKKYSGTDEDITMTVRLLKGIPVIGTVKRTYDNDVNNKTFWGLLKWYAQNDFHSDFHPYS